MQRRHTVQMEALNWDGLTRTLSRNGSAVRSLLVASLALASLAVIAGCNTVEGVGKDMEAAGEGIQDAADDDD